MRHILYITPSVAVCLYTLSLGLLLQASFPFHSIAQTSGSITPQDAWLKLTPQIEFFWTEKDGSPVPGKPKVWQLISALRKFVQKYPKSPHAAEAYFLLGHAYAKVSFMPEAAAHWRIVRKKFPKSPWVPPALNALALLMEQRGEKTKSHKYFAELIRQFPDSNEAKAVRIRRACDAINAGKEELAAKEIEKIEETSPDIHITTPRFLYLKAKLAEAQGKRVDAKEYWLHYLNITKLPTQKAEALFRIAELYRSDGKFLWARKYYIVLKKDFPHQAESLFARFRLAQLMEQEKKRLSTYVKNTGTKDIKTDTAALYSDILKKFPDHPLTREVVLEFMTLRLYEGKYVEVMRLAREFSERSGHSPHMKEITGLMNQAEKALEEGKHGLEILEEAVAFGKAFFQKDLKGPLLPGITKTTQVLWLRLMDKLLAQKEFVRVLNDSWTFCSVFPGSDYAGKAESLGSKALSCLDRQLLTQGRPLDLVNHYYGNRKRIDSMKSSRHNVYLGQAWRELDCPEAAMRAYFQAWSLGPEDDEKRELLTAWAETALDAGDRLTVRNVVSLLEKACSDVSLTPLSLKAQIAGDGMDWSTAGRLAAEAMKNQQSEEKQNHLKMLRFKASVKLGDWPLVESMWKQMRPALPLDERISLLSFWGNEALRIKDYSMALEAYNQLLALEPDDPPSAWRVALAGHRMGADKIAMDEWKALTQVSDTLWAQAAKIVVKNEEFWQGPAEGFRNISQDAASSDLPGGVQ